MTLKKQVSWSGFIIAMIPVVMSIAGSYIALRVQNENRQTRVEVRLQYLEGNYQKLESKLDKISDDVNSIRVLLENKENRK